MLSSPCFALHQSEGSFTKMAMNESTTEKKKSAATVPNLVLLSAAFTQTPFAKPSKLNLIPTFSPNTIRDFQDSVVSSGDKLFRFLHSFASQNPVLRKALSLSSEFDAFCHQVRCRSSEKVKFPLSTHNFAAILPGDSVAGVVVANGILNFLNIYNSLLVIRLVLTWFPNSPPAIVSPLSTLCDPYLNIFRGIIPPLGGTLDLSPILAFLVLNAFTSTAAALPCELPPAGPSPRSTSTRPGIIDQLTSSQKKWMRRLHGNRSKSSGDAN